MLSDNMLWQMEANVEPENPSDKPRYVSLLEIMQQAPSASGYRIVNETKAPLWLKPPTDDSDLVAALRRLVQTEQAKVAQQDAIIAGLNYRIAEMEAQLRPKAAPEPSVGDRLARALRFDRPLDGYGR